MAAADGRVRQRRGRLRRQQIIDAAVELFATNGFRGTDVADVAERVGMTAMGLMYYFGTKARLLDEAVREHDRIEVLEHPDQLTLADFRSMGRHSADHELLTRLYAVLGAESLDPGQPLHHFFVDRYDSIRGLIRTVLRRDQERGLVRRDVDVDGLSAEILSVIMGAEMQWLADPRRVEVSGVMQAYIDRLVRELAP